MIEWHVLENTFLHIRGIGPKTECRLWDSGIRSWDDIPAGKASLPHKQARLAEDCIRESRIQLAKGNPDYFCGKLAANQHWRLFPHFRHSVAYLDIETTGLGAPDDYITVIGLYDGKSIRRYVHDDNLLDFKDDIREYKMLVTYNGKMFDIPFIRSYLNIPLQQAHIDLRFPLAALGYRGGLKNCERKLGIVRGDVEGIDGFLAVLLWRDYNNNGNEKALQTLLAYYPGYPGDGSQLLHFSWSNTPFLSGASVMITLRDEKREANILKAQIQPK